MCAIISLDASAQGGYVLPYHIHPADRPTLVIELAELLRKIPDEELEALIGDARKLHHDSEFGHRDRARNADRKDPYWYEHHLIASARKHIAEGNPVRALTECLEENNHGHSGFVNQTRRVYYRPQNKAERAVSDEIRHTIIEIASALIDFDPPRRGTGPLGQGWFAMVGIVQCVCMLGADIPANLVDRARTILLEYEKVDSSNRELPGLKRDFARRIG